MKQTPPLRSILNAFEEAVCLIDEVGHVSCVNAAAEQLLGYTEEELLGGPFLPNVNVAPSNDELVSRAGSVITQPDMRFWIPVQLLGKDGSVLEALCSRSVLVETGSMLLRFRRLDRDRTQDVGLPDIKPVLEAILDAVPEGVFVIDDSGNIQLFSAGAETLFGYQQDEVLYQNVEMLLPSPYWEGHHHNLATFQKTFGKRITDIGWEVSGRRKDGSVFPVCLSVDETWLNQHRFFVGVAYDLANLRRTEEQLLMLFAAINQSPSAILIADKEGRIEYINPRVTQLTGYAAGELIGQNSHLLLGAHDAVPSQLLRETLETGREWKGEIQGRTKSGDSYWAIEAILPLRDARGEITHFMSIQQDITDQKRNKEALAESEERFRHVAEMAGEWLWEQDPQGRYIYSSAAVIKILGFSPQEILGKSYLDLLAENGEEKWIATQQASVVSRQPFNRLVNRYRHKDGRDVYTESTGAPILDEQGHLVKWRGVDHDITSRKAYVDALRLRDRAIESVDVGIAISDARAPGYQNIYVNPALCRMTGYTRDELLGRSMNLLQGLETDSAVVRQIREALERGKDCEVTLKNYRKDGSVFWNELLISPVVDDAGKLTHYIGVQTDVTERRKAEESRRELEIARQIQRSLLPAGPLRLPGVEVAGLCVPANQVGGDYFDFFQQSNALDLVVADVSGHSVAAGLIMTEVRSALRAEARRKPPTRVSPAQILRELNAFLYDDLNKADLFMTMFHMQFEPESRSLKYANAGHNWALHLPEGGSSCVPLDAKGLVIGVLPEIDFEEKVIQLSPGDKLMLYTDGVVETQNPRGDFFDLDRLCVLLSNHRQLAPEALAKQVLKEVRAFAGPAPQRDDITIAIMQIN